MWWSGIITAKSWRAGAKLIHEELGVPVTGGKRPGDLPQSSANDVDAADDDDNKEEENDHQQQDKTGSDVLLQDLVTVTAGNI